MWTDGTVFDPMDLGLDGPRSPWAVMHGVVLKRTLPPLVAYRAIQRMVKEIELQDSTSGLLHMRSSRVDDHPLCYRGCAGDHQLGRLLHLNETHPTDALDGEPGVIAIMRDVDPELLSRLNDRGPWRDLDLPAVNIDRHPIWDFGHPLLLA